MFQNFLRLGAMNISDINNNRLILVFSVLLRAFLVSTMFLPFTVASSYAQSTEEKTPKVRQNRMLEEVVVTAQKRAENNQYVPISVTAFSEDTLDALGITDPQEL